MVIPSPWARGQEAPDPSVTESGETLAETPALWLGPDGRPLPFTDFEEAEEFLRQGRVISSEEFGTGITGLRQLVLEHGGVRARAAFHAVDETVRDIAVKDRRYREHHDSYRSQCAAYALARLLDIDNVPPTVCRSVDGVDGSVQLWVEEAMTEKTRLDEGLRPAKASRWIRQVHRMRLFDSLIDNDDRHAQNFLIDPAWNLWLIDHTRAFQHGTELREVRFAFCDRAVWERLQNVTDDELRAALSPYLDPGQLRGLLRRRQALVQHIRARIAERGEAAVLIDRVGR